MGKLTTVNNKKKIQAYKGKKLIIGFTFIG